MLSFGRSSSALLGALLLIMSVVLGAEESVPKCGPAEALASLKAGNDRFVSGRSENPHTDSARLRLAGSASQADYAYATVLTCSDSRIPIERVFDAGVMDLFVVRVAGNVCNTDEIGSIEYGLAHVKTPLLVILGHTQCGAVTAVTQHLKGKGHALERNIPPLVKSIEPAVKRALRWSSEMTEPQLISRGIEENVWTAIENLFLNSPAVRELVVQEKVKVVGGIYDVATGIVAWLPENKVQRLLGTVDANPNRALNPMADSEGHDVSDTAPSAEAHGAPAAHGSKEPLKSGEKKTADAHADPHADPHTDPHAVAHADAHKPEGSAPHAEAPHGSAKTDSKAPKEHAEKGSEDPHAAKSSEHGHGGGEEESKDAHASAATAPAVPGEKPWNLIAACGVVFVLGAGVALFGHFSSKSTASAAHATAPAAATHAPSAVPDTHAPAPAAPEAHAAPSDAHAPAPDAHAAPPAQEYQTVAENAPQEQAVH